MPEFEDMDAGTLGRALRMVHEHAGITMTCAKQSMLQSRLRPRLRLLNIGSYAQYLRRLGQDEAERQVFIDVVTTHHTAFFRTPRIWRYFGEVFLPAFAARHADKPLRVWSAATSSGEEACTIAMCCEEFSRRQPGFSYQVSATDISVDVVERARAGDYGGTSVAAFHEAQPELFMRYNALGTEKRFRLPQAVRERIDFSAHHLFRPPHWTESFDVIFLRNVLIYFNPDDVRTVLRNIAPALGANGVLIIGEAESLTGVDVPFQFMQPQIYRRTA